MRIGRITFPGRFRFTHDAGQGYRHYIEATFFGLPLMKVNEHYLDGKSRLELPFGVTEGKPKTLWLNEVLGWGVLNGNVTVTVAAVTWLDEGTPWAVFKVEEVVYNVDVREYIRAKGT